MSQRAFTCSLTALVLLLVSARAFADSNPVACSLLFPEGQYAALTVSGSKVSLRYSAGDTARVLDAEVHADIGECHLFQIEDLHLLVAALSGRKDQALQLLYADRDANQWLDSKPYSPRLLIPGPRIAGLNPKNPHQLVVIDSGQHYSHSDRAVFRPTFITVSRKVRALNPDTMILSLPAPDPDGFHVYVDAPRLRLWYPDGVGSCDLHAVALIGGAKERSMPAANASPAHCSVPGVVGFPSENQVAIGYQSGDDVIVRLATLDPAANREGKLQRSESEALVLSPQDPLIVDNLLAVAVSVLRHEGLAGAVQLSNRIEFVELADLHVAGSLDLPEDGSSQSVSFRRDGNTARVMYFGKGAWQTVGVTLH